MFNELTDCSTVKRQMPTNSRQIRADLVLDKIATERVLYMDFGAFLVGINRTELQENLA